MKKNIILLAFLIVVPVFNTACKPNENQLMDARVKQAQAEAEKAKSEEAKATAEAEIAKAEEAKAVAEAEKAKSEEAKATAEAEKTNRALNSLKLELVSINESTELAKTENAKYSGGLIKSLIEVRLELLQINSSLVQQRINALESGTKIEIKLYESKPNLERARQLQSDMKAIRSKIEEKNKEIARYSGGLIKVTLMSSVASMENSLAILQTEYLKAKYGIYWLPNNDPTKKTVTASSASTPAALPSKSEKILIPKISNKKLKKAKYDSNIWFDVAWNTDGLTKKTRAVKGVLIFADLFGEVKLRVTKTINEPLLPQKPYAETGIGFEYNQFTDSHQWVVATDLKDMTFKFKVTNIIYDDGTTEEFD